MTRPQPRDDRGRFAKLSSYHLQGIKTAKRLTTGLDQAHRQAIANPLDIPARKKLEALGDEISTARNTFTKGEILPHALRGLEARHDRRLDDYYDRKSQAVQPQVDRAKQQIHDYIMTSLQAAQQKAIAKPSSTSLEAKLDDAHQMASWLGDHLQEPDSEFQRKHGRRVKAIQEQIDFLHQHANEQQRSTVASHLTNQADSLAKEYETLPEPKQRAEARTQQLLENGRSHSRSVAQAKLALKKKKPDYQARQLEKKAMAINALITQLHHQNATHPKIKQLMKQRNRLEWQAEQIRGNARP